MTRKEAIHLLDNLIGMVADNHGNDYDSALHMAIDTMRKYQMMQADYETRLKADLVAMLRELKYDLYYELCKEIHGKEDCPCVGQTISCLATFRVCDANRAIDKVIQQKINSLKAEKEQTDEL